MEKTKQTSEMLEISSEPVMAEPTPSPSMNTATITSETQNTPQEESVVYNPNTGTGDSNSHEGELPSILEEVEGEEEDDDELPLIHMNSKAAVMTTSKKTVKKIGSWNAATHALPQIAEKPRKSVQNSSAKRLPTQGPKGPVSSISSLSMTSLKNANISTVRGTTTTTASLTKAASLLDAASQTKKKKKMFKSVGDTNYNPEGNSSKLVQLYPYMYGQSQPSPPHLSAAQAAVDEMMRQNLQEYQYSAMGSIVETDSESQGDADEIEGSHKSENDFLTRIWCVDGAATTISPRLVKMDRSLLLASMKNRLRIEAQSTQHTLSNHPTSKKDTYWENEEDESNVYNDDNYLDGFEDEQRKEDVKMKNFVEINGQGSFIKVDSKHFDQEFIPKEDIHSKRKRKRGIRREGETDVGMGTFTSNEPKAHDVNHEFSDSEDHIAKVIAQGSYSDVSKVGGQPSGQIEDYYEDEDIVRKEMEESSIFSQTQGSANATWVECDKCGKWRRLRGIVDEKKLPTKWYCSMNKRDPDRAKCTAPEEKYDAATATPESAADQRARKHLRLWVRRLNSNENYETRMLTTMTRGKKKSNATSSKDPYEWVRCCNPSCGKWRALLKFMDSSSVIEAAKNGEWYCVMNTWDEKLASCAGPQEHLPTVTPPWVIRDDMI